MKDPQEMQNEYNNPTYANIVAELKNNLKDLRLKYKDDPELDKKYIDLYKSKNNSHLI